MIVNFKIFISTTNTNDAISSNNSGVNLAGAYWKLKSYGQTEITPVIKKRNTYKNFTAKK